MTFKKNNQKSNVKKSSNFAKLGAILRNKEGGLYIKFDKDTQVEINGVDVSGAIANLEKPADKFERMVASGHMTAEEAEERISAYEEGGKLDFVRQEISIRLGQ